MKNTCRILPILMACLVLTPSLAVAGQPAYPKHFVDLSIPQLPGSKVAEVRREGGGPVTVVLESTDLTEGRYVVIFYTLDSKPFKAAWDYLYDETKKLESEGRLQTKGVTVNMLYANKRNGEFLLIKVSPKGKEGSWVELTYPWAHPDLWFHEFLKKGVNPK